jgi:hypothetical protein
VACPGRLSQVLAGSEEDETVVLLPDSGAAEVSGRLSSCLAGRLGPHLKAELEEEEVQDYLTDGGVCGNDDWESVGESICFDRLIPPPPLHPLKKEVRVKKEEEDLDTNTGEISLFVIISCIPLSPQIQEDLKFMTPKAELSRTLTILQIIQRSTKYLTAIAVRSNLQEGTTCTSTSDRLIQRGILLHFRVRGL